MGADFLTPKAIANRIKAKGLQKLRWYCQMCEKQCRDENGFKCHCASEAHQRQMMLFAETPEKYIEMYSSQFMEDFLRLLSRRYNTKRVHANLVYQEYISDRNHLHMNATRWESLSEFVKWMGKEGICHVDETPKGWFIQWIDRSPQTLAKQEAIQRKERLEKTEEEIEQKLLEEQIRKARELAEKAESQNGDDDEEKKKELVREGGEDEKIKLNLQIKSSTFLKPAAAKTTTVKPTANKLNALAGFSSQKKTSTSSLSSSSSFSAFPTASSSSSLQSANPSQTRKLTAMEQIILEETRKKERRQKAEGSAGASTSFSAPFSSSAISFGSREKQHRDDRDDGNRSHDRGYDRDGRDKEGERNRDYRDRDRDRDGERKGKDRDRDEYERRDRDWERHSERDRDRDRDRDADRDRDRKRDDYARRDYRDGSERESKRPRY
ncbi:hypothetical protein HK102_004999 [Quaeritorhiza haematococci]|nr:hypothetical protein HK102_004999 [Quaeritorhiza haematococci]